MVIGRVWIKVELVSSSDAVFVFVYKWYRELQGDGVVWCGMVGWYVRVWYGRVW